MSVKRIAIIGAGIIGITTAYKIKELMPDAIITLYADEYSPYTTSDVSAGYWEPFCLNDSDDKERERIVKWSKEAYERFVKLAYSSNANTCGVQILPAVCLDSNESVTDPYWSKVVHGYRRMNRSEIQHYVDATNAKSAFTFTTTTLEVKKYIPYLMNILEKNGVRFIKAKISKISDLYVEDPESRYSYIINCTGLGARELVGDNNVYPVRGLVLRVEAPWIKNCIMYDSNPEGCMYLLPLSNLVVVGGTIEENVYTKPTNDDEYKAIMKRNRLLVPSLENAKIVEKAAGFRPSRKGGVRLELEVIRTDKGPIKVIHNYGHGGSGITLSWGCASEVVDIIKQDLKQIRSNL